MAANAKVAEPDGRAASPRAGKATQRWVVYSTFDAAGRSSESAVAQVRAYREAGFDVLVVDTSAGASAQRRADWAREATWWFERPNIGYDFGSFKAGLLHLTERHAVPAEELDVVFANDSCFGPFVSLVPIFDRFDSFPLNENRVFGITDSIQDVHHIQSYWVYFRSDTSRLAFEFFLGEMLAATDRTEAIALGELALGRFLASRGCVLEVVCPVRATVARLARFNGWLASTLEFGLRRLARRWKYSRDADTQCLRHLLHLPEKLQYFNPIVLFGVQLHRLNASPFVKKSMFRENVYRDPAIPAPLDVDSMTNADVRRLFQ